MFLAFAWISTAPVLLGLWGDGESSVGKMGAQCRNARAQGFKAIGSPPYAAASSRLKPVLQTPQDFPFLLNPALQTLKAFLPG